MSMICEKPRAWWAITFCFILSAILFPPAHLAAADKILDAADLQRINTFQVDDQTYVLYGPSPNYIVTDNDGVIQRARPLCRRVVYAQRLYLRYTLESELEQSRRIRASVDGYRKWKKYGQVALLVRNAASSALVEVGVFYMTGDAAEMTRDAARRLATSAAKAGLKDAVKSFATSPDTYLRALAWRNLNDATATLQRIELRGAELGSLNGKPIPVAELETLDCDAQEALVRITPSADLIDALSPSASVSKQIEDVANTMVSQLLSRFPAADTPLMERDASELLSDAANAFDAVYKRYKPYSVYQKQVGDLRSEAAKHRATEIEHFGQQADTGLSSTAGFTRVGVPETSSPATVERFAGNIREGIGIGKLVVRQSTIPDVKQCFGDEFTERRPYAWNKLTIYDKLGIEFRIDPRDDSPRLTEIRFRAPFTGATSRGIAVGTSSAADVIRASGAPNWYTFERHHNWFVSYPGVDFEIEGGGVGSRFTNDMKELANHKVVAIAVTRIDRDDLFPTGGRLPNWEQAGLWGSGGGTSDGKVTQFKHGEASRTSFNFDNGEYETACGLGIREFPDRDTAVRLGRQNIEEQLKFLRKREGAVNKVDLKGAFGEHAVGVIRKNTRKQWLEVYCFLDRYYIEIDDRGDGDSIAQMLERFGELYDYLDRQVHFYDEQKPASSTAKKTVAENLKSLHAKMEEQLRRAVQGND